jgi:transposase
VVFAGVDWASEEHACCLVDTDGRIVAGRRFGHDERGLVALCAHLVERGVERVALERPDGLLIDRLLDAGLNVIAVHPNQVAAMRPRYQVGGGKSDNFDAFVLAELARTDAHRFRVLVPDTDETKALRALTRARQDMVGTRVQLANELRAQLDCFWPGAARVFAAIDSPIALAFLKRYPSPPDARNLTETKLDRFLARHSYSGRKPARELLGRLQAGAEGRSGAHETNTRRQNVLGLDAALTPITGQIRHLTRQIRDTLHGHADGHIFTSLFRDPDTVITAARMLAEIGDDRGRYPTYRALAADNGSSPVAVESGKRAHARFRYACDHRLRDAFATLADTTRKTNPWAKDIYDRARRRGATHPHALRILARAWTQIIWRMWHDRQPYDPTQHRAFQRHLAAPG